MGHNLFIKWPVPWFMCSCSLCLMVLSQKWDRLPGVRYTSTHTERRYCLYCICAQLRVLGDNSTKLAHCLAESQGLYTHVTRLF